jgi:hypothetical protein
MVTGEDGPGQVIEAARAGPAIVPLPVGLGVVLAVLDHIPGVATGAGDPVGPAEVTNGLKALGIVDEVRQIDQETGLGQSTTESARGCG